MTQGERITKIETKVESELGNGLSGRVARLDKRLQDHIEDENHRFDRIAARQWAIMALVVASLVTYILTTL